MHDRGQVEATLEHWRNAERFLCRPAVDPARRAAYERAVATALGRLRGYTTLAQLMDAYFNDRLELDDLHRGEHALNAGLVEDAAFWRRAQELLAQCPG
jgi:hypothetical protein